MKINTEDSLSYDLNRQTAVGTNIIKDTSRFLQKPLAYFDNQIFFTL